MCLGSYSQNVATFFYVDSYVLQLSLKDGSSKLILKRLKSKPSGILDVSNSAKWLQLDRIHHDHVTSVAGAHSVQTEVRGAP